MYNTLSQEPVFILSIRTIGFSTLSVYKVVLLQLLSRGRRRNTLYVYFRPPLVILAHVLVLLPQKLYLFKHIHGRHIGLQEVPTLLNDCTSFLCPSGSSTNPIICLCRRT